jgi:hypothetical protein
VVLGGLIVSTFFTMILIPAGFSLVMDALAAIQKMTERVKSKVATLPLPGSGLKES